MHSHKLVDAGLAVIADNGAILLRWTDDMPIAWRDRIGGDMQITDRMIATIDGLPLVRGGNKLGQVTYQFASVVDDYTMDISMIIRGVDHITNTGKQIAIWHALNKSLLDSKPFPTTAHVGLVFKDGKKMSTRDGAASLLDYSGKGYDPDGMFNFLLRLGWGPHNDNRSMTFIDRDRAIDLFLDHGNMKSSNAGFDQMKLDFYDRRYIQLKWKAAQSS